MTGPPRMWRRVRGGKSLEVQLAVDFDEDAIAVFRSNFAKLGPRVQCASVESYFDGELGGVLTPAETGLKKSLSATPHFLVDVPPCQGHSDLNNHRRRDDPRLRGDGHAQA